MKVLANLRTSCVEAALHGLEWIARRQGRATDLAAHLETGIDGENAAYFYLRRKGYTVVAQRWSSRKTRGDLDLIAWRGPLLCIIEVKTRTAHDEIPAEYAVKPHKRDSLRALARDYISRLPSSQPPPVRFDVLSVYLLPGRQKEFHHFEATFGWSDWDSEERWE